MFNIATNAQPFASGTLMGLKVAVTGFYANLIKHGDYEHLYFASQMGDQNGDYRSKCASALKLSEAELKRVDFIDFKTFVEKVQSKSVDIIHRPDLNIFEGINLKRNLANHELMVTGMTHSLNNTDSIREFIQLGVSQASVKDSIVCTSPTARHVIEKLYQKIEIMMGKEGQLRWPSLPLIPLGIEPLSEGPPLAEARGQLNLPQDHVIVTYVGRIHSLVKADLRPMISVMKKLLEKHEKLLFIIAGSLSSKDKTEIALLHEEIKQLGLRNKVGFIYDFQDSEKSRILAASDIFYSPVDNFQETFGLSIIEAMAHGKPIVCSDWGGYRDLVDHGENGFLIPSVEMPTPSLDAVLSPGFSYIPLEYSLNTILKCDVLFEQLDELISRPDLREKMGARSKQKAEHYQWPNIIKQYMKMWKEQADFKVSEACPKKSLSVAQSDLFESYFTETISTSATFQLIDEHVEHIPRVHPLLLSYIEDEDIKAIVEELRNEGSQSLDCLSKKLRLPSDKLGHGLAFLLKMGLVQVVRSST